VVVSMCEVSVVLIVDITVVTAYESYSMLVTSVIIADVDVE